MSKRIGSEYDEIGRELRGVRLEVENLSSGSAEDAESRAKQQDP